MRENPGVPDADIRWQEYRESVTKYIDSQCREKERILILGAGRCNDLDLQMLGKKHREIWLADIDRKSMEEAVLRLPIELQNRIRLVETDFVSISEEEFAQYELACRQGIPELEQWWWQYERKFTDGLQVMRDIRDCMQEQKIESFDTVICLGLHSQLYMELILCIYARREEYGEDVKQQAVWLIQKANARIAGRFLDEIQLMGKRLFLGLEYTTVWKEEETLREQIIQQLSQYGSDGLRRMNVSRVEGAWQMEQEIGKRYQAGNLMVQDYQFLFWPFSEEKSYLMVIFMIV